ncbi:MAG: putative O-glycosylation ligase, exosortase A system-associated [Phycisphaerae bacterium]|nr:putative O-glycosylation ligase, exosortase A system-associated [Phycisphaerae bacterium]
MGIRDIIMTILGYGAIPYALTGPFQALMAYCWLSFMKPQSLVWSSDVQGSRFVFFVGICLILRGLFSDSPRFRLRGPATWFMMFWFWMGVSTVASASPDDSMEFFEKFSKIGIALMLMTGLIRTRAQLKSFVILMAMCPGLYAIRLGLFMVRGGTRTHHGGPMGMDNNDTALFIAMGIPMLVFATTEVLGKWRRRGMFAAAMLAVPAVVAGGSRGGLLAMSMSGGITLWRRYSLKRAVVLGLMAIPVVLAILPEETRERYLTMKTYDKDASAMGRIWAWETARNMAKARPMTGVGIGMPVFLDQYNKYKTHSIDKPHVAHSVWFSTLAGMGYPGLILLIGMILSTLLTTRRIRRMAMQNLGGKDEWAWRYAAMLEATTLAFATGATFLSQIGFEYAYAIFLMSVPLLAIVEQETKKLAETPPVEENSKPKPKKALRPGRQLANA